MVRVSRRVEQAPSFARRPEAPRAASPHPPLAVPQRPLRTVNAGEACGGREAQPPTRGGGRGSRPFLGSPVGVATDAISSPQRHGGQGGATCAGAFGRPELPVPSAASGRSARADRRHPGRPCPCGSEARPGTTADTLNLHGPVPRVLPVCFLAVSRPLELSLQSSFQLSLTVLVCYRSRASI